MHVGVVRQYLLPCAQGRYASSTRREKEIYIKEQIYEPIGLEKERNRLDF